MRKKRMQISPSYREGCRRILVCFSHLMILLLVFNLNLSAKAFSQYQKVTVNLKNAGIEEFISAIKQQCDVGFIYDYSKAREIPAITIDVKEGLITDVLEQALKGSGFVAEIENNTIVIRKTDLPQVARQGVKIRGKVFTEDGNVIPGATVLIKGTTLGTAADDNGEFELTLPEPEGKILLVSFIGMESREVEIKDPQELLRVVLKTSSENLNEVVVTGIFSRKKESFTGSAATYSSSELKAVGNQNIIQSLKTLDPSLLVLDSKEWGSDPN
ncbi:MAG: carboxypeptidase-like regulatory domain-containing protein, partial [Odoribacter sp.]|nr:carboxypeptidase-like regulatory domain-containing protein [Odoribacter sp.]